MDKRNIIRSPVYVVKNSEGGIYEVGLAENEWWINIAQIEVWWGNSGELHDLVRKVHIKVTEQVYKIGMKLEGSICIALTTEIPNIDDETDHMWPDEDGAVQYTDAGKVIYGYWYYYPEGTHIPIGEQVYDDNINKFIKQKQYGR